LLHRVELGGLSVAQDSFESRRAKIAAAAGRLKRLVGRTFDASATIVLRIRERLACSMPGSTSRSFTFAIILSSAIWAMVSSFSISPIRSADSVVASACRACPSLFGGGLGHADVGGADQRQRDSKNHIPNRVILAARPPQRNRLLGNEDVFEDDRMRPGAAHPHRLPNSVDANPLGGHRNREMQNLTPRDRVVVLTAGDQQVTGEAAACEDFLGRKPIAALARRKSAVGVQPIRGAGTDENLLAAGNGTQELFARFAVAVVP
jgi:hypothetical protein